MHRVFGGYIVREVQRNATRKHFVHGARLAVFIKGNFTFLNILKLNGKGAANRDNAFSPTRRNGKRLRAYVPLILTRSGKFGKELFGIFVIVYKNRPSALPL